MSGPPRRGVRTTHVLVSTIERVVVHRVRLPLREPFVAAHGTERDREVVLVEAVAEDGIHGWGECVALSAPTYSNESTEGAWVRLRDEMVPTALQRGFIRDDDAPMAAAAFEAAIDDVALRRDGRSLGDVLRLRGADAVRFHAQVRMAGAPDGLGRHATVPCTAVIGRQPSIEALLARVDARLAEGYGSIKVKIAPGWDLEPLRAVRTRWPDLALAVDANGSYLEDDATLAALDDLQLQYIEQPLAAQAYAAHARLADRLTTPIALDESIRGERELDHALAFGVRYIVNLKPGRVGGTAEAVGIVLRAQQSDLSVFVGGMLETGVGRAYALAFAGMAACDLPTDLGPSTRYFAEDLTDPVELLSGGRVAIPDGPGIGAEPHRSRLEAATVDRVELAR
jgi:O-succinylbenzoate synthase